MTFNTINLTLRGPTLSITGTPLVRTLSSMCGCSSSINSRAAGFGSLNSDLNALFVMVNGSLLSLRLLWIALFLCLHKVLIVNYNQ